ncbi:MAG: CocE/NonD family hydrolase, partial [Thermoplasmatota archaeon]
MLRGRTSLALLTLMGMLLVMASAGSQSSGDAVDTAVEQLDAGEPVSPIHVRETYMVPMRDDVRLATDVYLQYAGFPSHGSVLIRTPYNKDIISLFHPRWQVGENADRGWPTIVQDMRGKYASEGDDHVMWKSHVDGPDTLQWMAEQNWSNGRVATIGRSALGITQYFMAGATPPELSGQFMLYATPDLHRDAFFQGGQLRKSLMQGWLELMGSTHILPEALQHENFTRAYWGNVSLEG